MTAWEFLPWGLCAVVVIGYAHASWRIWKLHRLIEVHCSREHGMRLPIDPRTGDSIKTGEA